MISEKFSLKISKVLVKLVIAGLIACVFLTPVFLEHYIIRFSKSSGDFVFLTVLIYASLLPAFAAVLSLNRLLKNISLSHIFEEENVKLLRIISWCCFAVAVIYGAFGFAYTLSLLIGFAALFFGLILRVLKNVFAQAVSIKEENDYTV